MPEAKPRDTKIPKVLLLLVNDTRIMLVPKAILRDTNSIFYYYIYSANIPNHLLLFIGMLVSLGFASGTKYSLGIITTLDNIQS